MLPLIQRTSVAALTNADEFTGAGDYFFFFGLQDSRMDRVSLDGSWHTTHIRRVPRIHTTLAAVALGRAEQPLPALTELTSSWNEQVGPGVCGGGLAGGIPTGADENTSLDN